MVVIELRYVDNARLIIDSVDRMVSDPQFDSDFDLCVEYRSLNHVPSPSELRALVVWLHRFGLRHFAGRCAIVGWTPETREAARQFAALLHAPADRMRVFSDCREAVAWFDLSGVLV